MLIALLLASSSPTLAEVRHRECRELAMEDAAAGADEARQWLNERGGWRAEQCLGFALAQGFNWVIAADAFDRAATAAATEKSAAEAGLWVQAGNASLAGEDAERAIGYFDKGIALGTLSGEQLGEAWLDKARALVALNREEEAIPAFAKVHELTPQDPLGWLLSATLARRRDDLVRADADIRIAASLAPTDPAIALELGNIAAAKGDLTLAAAQWQRTTEIDAASLPGRAAKRQLDALGKGGAPKEEGPSR